MADPLHLSYLPPQKPKGFSKDPEVIMASAERLANVSIIFAILGVVFGIFSSFASIETSAFNLGLAGAGLVMVIGTVNTIGIGVAILTGLVSLVSSIIFASKTKRKVKPIIITASVSLAIVVIYYIAQRLIMV